MENNVRHNIGGFLRAKSGQGTGIELSDLTDALSHLCRGQLQPSGNLADSACSHRFQVAIHHIPQIRILLSQNLNLFQQTVL